MAYICMTHFKRKKIMLGYIFKDMCFIRFVMLYIEDFNSPFALPQLASSVSAWLHPWPLPRLQYAWQAASRPSEIRLEKLLFILPFLWWILWLLNVSAEALDLLIQGLEKNIVLYFMFLKINITEGFLAVFWWDIISSGFGQFSQNWKRQH